MMDAALRECAERTADDAGVRLDALAALEATACARTWLAASAIHATVSKTIASVATHTRVHTERERESRVLLFLRERERARVSRARTHRERERERAFTIGPMGASASLLCIVRAPPEWLDVEQVRLGQAVFAQYLTCASIALLFLSLIGGFSALSRARLQTKRRDWKRAPKRP